ncbi:hypothetical protein SAMN04488105_104334 [Salipiger thiooxidans]|uniref:Uncharacterized protein n=1 Tax=Salipiger thiooxidans TaxID=282683 RepID=A0A1G7DNH8_9RHOB|nr:hypothetical protein SAMN04488105_104334 [Salipiger thiooxidans]
MPTLSAAVGPLRSFVWLAALRRSFAKPDIGGILQQDLARQGHYAICLEPTLRALQGWPPFGTTSLSSRAMN